MRKNLFLTSFVLLIILFSVSVVSAADNNFTESTSVANNAVDYYVDLGGDDNNLGSEISPFNTLQKPISLSKHQDEVTIHLGEGIFNGKDNTMITINKAHISQGGYITIQGQGPEKTIIDGTGQYYIFDIKSDTKLILKDLSIINCKSLTGGAIVNNGKLTIDNCLFNNNYAVKSAGAIYSYEGASLNIYNSVFENSRSCNSGGAIYSYKADLLIDKTDFINNIVEDSDWYSLYGGAVCIKGYSFNTPSISNTRFINNSVISHYWKDVAIYGGSLYMEKCGLNNVSFINSKIDGIGAQGGSYYAPSNYINIMKDILRINSTVNGVLENNIYPPDYNGQYSKTAVYYVSPTGSDLNGDGSIENPFATIAHAIEISNGKVYNLDINLLDGEYVGLGNTNVTIPDSLNVRIKGLHSGKVIINGENTNFFINVLTSFSGFKHEIANITFNNMKYQSGGYGKDDNKGIIHSFADLSIKSCLFTNCNGLIFSFFDNSFVSIEDTKFLDNSGENLFSYDSHVKFTNCLINNTKNINRYLFSSEQHNIDDANLIFENSTISNNIHIQDRFIFDVEASNLTFSNSNISNNKGYLLSAIFDPYINIINSSFNANIQKGNYVPVGKWKVENSNFTDNWEISFKGVDSYRSIFSNVLFLNNKNGISLSKNIVVQNSAIYDVIDAGSNDLNLNYNYWSNTPSTMINGNVGVDYWILKSIKSENLFNGSYRVFLSYTLNNGKVYNIDNIPILPESFVLTSSNNQINPKEGILTKNGFEAIGNFDNDDQKVVANFKDGSKLELDVLNQHKSEIDMKLSSNNLTIGDNLKVEINVIDVKNGKRIDEGILNLYLNGQLIESFNVNGQSLIKNIKVSGDKCVNVISAEYLGNSNFNASSKEDKFIISSIPLNTIIIAHDLTKYFKNSSKFEIRLIDGLGNSLANEIVTFTINGISYNRSTDSNGIASLSIGLNPGIYKMVTSFKGSESLDNCSAVNSVTVLKSLYGENITKMFRNGTQYHIKVLDNAGNPLVNTTVVMNINGVFYRKITNGSGIATLNINLNPGEYILTAYHPLTGLRESNLITVRSCLEAESLSMFYKDGSYFETRLLDDHGNPLADEEVTFNVNGVFYNRLTDSNGVVKLAIRLMPKDYIITAYYGESRLSRFIHIDPMVVQIVSSDPSIKKGGYYSVQFKDAVGNPIVGEDVAMVVNKVRYMAKTNGEGVASLKLDVNPGVYIIESGLTSNCYVSKSIYAKVVVAK